jgi:hypothetical protein
MKLTDKEALKVLAEAIIDFYYESNPNGADYCRFCDMNTAKTVAIIHHKDCPVLFAEEILNGDNI